MRLRGKSGADEAFDGLTAEEVRRIRAASDVMVTPGMEGLARVGAEARSGDESRRDAYERASAPAKNKRGRRA